MLHLLGLPGHPHSILSSPTYFVLVRAEPDVDGVAEVIAETLEGCWLLSTEDNVDFN